MLRAIARFTYRRRRLVVLGWIILLVGVFAAAGAAGGSYRTDFRLDGSEASDAFDLLKRSGFAERSGTQGQVVFETRDGVADPAVRETMQGLFDDIERTVSGSAVDSPYGDDPRAQQQIAERGNIAYAELNIAERSQEGYDAAANRVQALVDGIDVPGLKISLGGNMFWHPAVSGVSEGIGILAAMVILLVAFGSVVAMGLPIMTALFGIGCAAGFVLIARNVIEMPDFTMSAVAMVGLGVGIDYALLIVTRCREGLDAGLDPERAVIRSINTAGRAAMFAGFTVMISVLGMLFMNLGSFDGVAIAISIGVALTMLASLTLLPALLGFVGENITRFGLPHRKLNPKGTVWRRWSLRLQRRPWPYAIAGTVVLLLLASPALAMRLGFGDGGNNPETETTRIAYDTLSRGFGPGFNGPLLIAAETPGADDATAAADLRDAVASTKGVASVSPLLQNDDGTVTIMQVFPTTAPQDAATADLVRTLRDDIIPGVAADAGLDVKVGGVTAAVDDFAAYTTERLPIFIGLVLILSFLLLMLVFRSLLVPLKAVIMNLLSIGAAYGVIVVVFQWGWGASLLGIPKAGPIEAWAPIFLFAVVFGLSMDYEVFLLSRIKEEYDRTHDNANAVANGLAVTARVITAAAAIMVCVFGSFIFGPDRSLQLFGLGLAIAVLIDATIVRLVLVPATMELLGDGNWWLPRWLEFLPRVHVDGAEDVDAELAELTEREGSVPV